MREVYIISDLHIGGRYPESHEPHDRGFRICTHVDVLARFVDTLSKRRSVGVDVELIINGDFLDFLAEEDPAGKGFVPFIQDPGEALRGLETILSRDRALFEALRGFTGRGGRLTLLLGNHDVELALPQVRHRLIQSLGEKPSARVTFLYDGEAYAVGDALIEHGNRYDGFNVVDHEGLRRVRSLQSRAQPVPPEYAFQPPPGSRLVASIMNPIKQDYPFVDLLKPETQAVVPILLALEPGFRGKALELLRFWSQAARHAPVAPAMPVFGGDIAALGDSEDFGGDLGSVGAPADALAAELAQAIPPDVAARFVAALGPEPVGGDIASGEMNRIWGLARLAAGRAAEAVELRLPALLEALRAVQNDRSFDEAYETVPAYVDAARKLAEGGFRYIVFGHTHLAKNVDLGGRAYLNSGTWADLIRFPKAIVTPGNPHALDELRDFIADMVGRRFTPWIEFRPTYVRLDVRGERVAHAELCTFR
ncbi:MAG: hypothetical protein JXB05_38805 [Myxococcaceae bacterium]|nr:hypothetical protein [Myxococcaceae bacterium]